MQGVNLSRIWHIAYDNLTHEQIEQLVNEKPLKIYNLSFGWQLPFEEEDPTAHVKEWSVQWYVDYWHWSVYLSLIYVAVVFGLQKYMQKRPRYEIRRVLFLWNFGLSVFSLIGTIRCVPELLYSLKTFGFTYSVCVHSNGYGLPGIYAAKFTFSKVPELIDTLFVVLRKQRLIFLHWYHHITVMIFAWYCHSVQAGAGFAVCIWHFYISVLLNLPCNGDGLSMMAGCIMYVSYMILFLKFFRDTYITKALAASKIEHNGSKME